MDIQNDPSFFLTNTIGASQGAALGIKSIWNSTCRVKGRPGKSSRKTSGKFRTVVDTKLLSAPVSNRIEAYRLLRRNIPVTMFESGFVPARPTVYTFAVAVAFFHLEYHGCYSLTLVVEFRSTWTVVVIVSLRAQRFRPSVRLLFTRLLLEVSSTFLLFSAWRSAQMSMISMRFKKFHKRTGRKLQFDTKDPVGFDKIKVECFNCHKIGHFAKDYRAKGNRDSRKRDAGYNGNKARDNVIKLPSRPDVGIDYSKFTYRPKQTSVVESNSKPSKYASCESDSSLETTSSMPEQVENAPKVVCKPKVWTDAPIIKEYETDSDNDSVSNDDPHRSLKDNKIVDSGCSRYMTGNKAHLVDYQEFRGGSDAFRDSNGRISGKGKIKADKLDFEDVYYVEELKHYNLFFVSQMCDKKNKVLFTDTDCLVLSPDFKLPDENQVLLKIPKQHNMYSFNLKNIDPSRDLSCLFAKASIDESNKWHKRLGHVNFKNLNKLVKGNLVREIDLHEEHFVLPIWSSYSTTVKSSVDKIEKNIDFKTCLPFAKKAIRTKWVCKNKKDERGVVVRKKARLVDQGHRQEEGIDYDEVFASVARIEAIRIFLAFGSYMGFIVYQMDVKSAFLYGIIDEEVYVTQPPTFVGPKFPNKVKLKEYGIFISQDKYVAKIFKKFNFLSVKTASTPIKTQKPLVKEEEAVDVYVLGHSKDFIPLGCDEIFRYLKGQPKLGLWYPKVSSFDLKAYSDSDYAGANLDRFNFLYALMVNPTIYVSCIKQFWASATIKKVNDVVKLRALTDGKRVVVTEDIIRQALHLDDAGGVECLPN
nr:ribonuclease H-like domain-containing protein [Tanacetum cinerariifolium]